MNRFQSLVGAVPEEHTTFRALVKAARGEMRPGHKYEMRIPMGFDADGKPKYKYIYAKQPHWRGKFIHEMLEEGSAVRLPDPDGVVHVVGEDEEGNLRLKKEETGEVITVPKEELQRRLKVMHGEAISRTLSMREQEMKDVVKYGTLKMRQRVFEEASSFGLSIPAGFNLDGTEKAEAREEASQPEMLEDRAITLHIDALPEVDIDTVPDHVTTFINPDEGRGMYKMFRHQVEGIARILQSWKQRDGFLLTDDAGLGKTVTALGALMANAGKRNLIVVPTRGKDNLKHEVWRKDASVFGIDLKDAADSFTAGGEGELDTYHEGTFVASYDELYEKTLHIDEETGEEIEGFKMRPEFEGKFDAIIFDESHNMKNAASFRAQAAMQLQEGAKKVLYMSATPFTNITDMHYLRRLSGLKEEGKAGWFSTGKEFVGWAKKAGAHLAKTLAPVGDVPQKLINPATPKPLVMVSALMHATGAGIKRIPNLAKALTTNFHRTELASVPEEHRQAFSTADEIFGHAKEAGLEARRIGAAKALWNRQMWEICKLDETVAKAQEVLAKDKSNQVTIFTAHVNHDHNVLDGLTKAIQERVDDGKLSAEKGAESIAKIKGLVDTLPRVDVQKELLNRLGGHEKVAMIHGRANELGAKHLELEAGVEHTWESAAKEAKMTVPALRNLNRGVDLSTAKSLKVAKAPTSIEAQQAYQGGEKRIVIGSMAKAGTGMSFHDLEGGRNRYQINVSLPYSGEEYQQVTGRSHRLGSKSDTHMIWIRGDSDSEHRISSIVSTKLQSMGALVQGDPGSLVSKELLMNYDHSTSTNPDYLAEMLSGEQSQAEWAASQKESEHAKSTFDLAVERIKEGGDPLAELGASLVTDRDRAKHQQARRAVGQLIHSGFHVRVTDDNRFAISGMPPGSTGHNKLQDVKRSASYDKNTGEWTIANMSTFTGLARRVGAHKKAIPKEHIPESMTNESLEAIHAAEKPKKFRQRLSNRLQQRVGDMKPDKAAKPKPKPKKKAKKSFSELVGATPDILEKSKRFSAITEKARAYAPGTKRVRKTGVWVKQVDGSWVKVRDIDKLKKPKPPAPPRREKKETIEEPHGKRAKQPDAPDYSALLGSHATIGLSEFDGWRALSKILASMLADKLKGKKAVVCVYNKHTKHKIEELEVGSNAALVFASKAVNMYADSDKYIVIIKDADSGEVLADNQGKDGSIRVLSDEGGKK